MPEIRKLEALEILDSRGNPTLAVTANSIERRQGDRRRFPPGLPPEKREAIELRDGDKSRYAGKGVLHACANVEEVIQKAVSGMSAAINRSWTGSFASWMVLRISPAWRANAILGSAARSCMRRP